MSISSQIFVWLATTYSIGFFLTWAMIVTLYAWLHVAERLFPAERNQAYRSMIVTNGRITLVFAVLGPVGMVAGQFFIGYAVATLARQLGAPWLFIDLNKVASIHS